jgi:hypothetical protein
MVIAGLVLMLIGAVDPLEGSLIILPGCGMVALGTFLGRSRRRKLLLWAFVLTALGFAALWAMSAIGGVGGDSGRSKWWALVLLPYPAGWVMGMVGAILGLTEASKGRADAEPPMPH